jgi:hypothetical protein
MKERDPMLEPFDALIGTSSTEATHPSFDGVVPGGVTFEWLEVRRFLVERSHHDHELFPDAICVIGAPEAGDGLVMEYFDSRGVPRAYGVSLDRGVVRMWRDHPAVNRCLRSNPPLASAAATRSYADGSAARGEGGYLARDPGSDPIGLGDPADLSIAR